MIDTYNTQEVWQDAYFDAIEFLNELDEEELSNKLILQEEIIPEDKPIHRKRRKNARKAKAHQLELATTLGSQHKAKCKSLYRWNPAWHKIKLSDSSPKKFKDRFDDAFVKNTIKEFNAS